MNRSLLRIWLIILGKLILGTCIGVVVALFYWALYLIIKANSFENAMSGQIEDAAGILQGIILVGSLIGGAVGLLFALGRKKE